MGRCLFDLAGGLVWLRSAIVEGDLDPDLASILALAGEALPDVVLSASGDDDVPQVDPGLPNQVGSLVVGEDGDLELVVVRRVVDGEAQFLVPGRESAGVRCGGWLPSVLPFGCLSSANVCGGLLGLLAQPGGAVGVLFADGLAVRQVLGPVDNGDQGADPRAVDGHVGIDASRVGSSGEGVRLGLGSHGDGAREELLVR